jgi:hypothetical protein
MRTLATALLILGLASILTNGAAVVLSREMSSVQAVLAVAYGIAAIVAGSLAWRRAPAARGAYLAWCVTITLYLATIPKLFAWYSLPAAMVAAFLLGWGYRYISRNVDHEGSIGPPHGAIG